MVIRPSILKDTIVVKRFLRPSTEFIARKQHATSAVGARRASDVERNPTQQSASPKRSTALVLVLDHDRELLTVSVPPVSDASDD